MDGAEKLTGVIMLIFLLVAAAAIGQGEDSPLPQGSPQSTPTPSPTPTPTSPPPPMLGLYINGSTIYDEDDNPVVLRGVNFARFIDTPYGDWIRPNGWIAWHAWYPEYAQNNLDAMASWGANVVRTPTCAEWWINNNANFRQKMKDWITMAEESGIYVVFTFRQILISAEQTPLPYPPYSEVNPYINSKQDFINLWISVATELKNYPSVLFELWNEPHSSWGNLTAEAEWFDVVQDTITAIRATGATNVIVFQWQMCTYLDYTDPYGEDWGKLTWIARALAHPVEDPLNNILFSTHIYRDNLFNVPVNLYSYVELDNAFNYLYIYNVTLNLNVALWIGEIGCNVWNEGDLDNEYAFYTNSLQLLNEAEIGFACWEWWVTGPAWGHIESGVADYEPAITGDILIDALGS